MLPWSCPPPSHPLQVTQLSRRLSLSLPLLLSSCSPRLQFLSATVSLCALFISLNHSLKWGASIHLLRFIQEEVEVSTLWWENRIKQYCHLYGLLLAYISTVDTKTVSKDLVLKSNVRQTGFQLMLNLSAYFRLMMPTHVWACEINVAYILCTAINIYSHYNMSLTSCFSIYNPQFSLLFLHVVFKLPCFLLLWEFRSLR